MARCGALQGGRGMVVVFQDIFTSAGGVFISGGGGGGAGGGPGSWAIILTSFKIFLVFSKS